MFSCFSFFFCEEGERVSKRHPILYDTNGGWMLKIKKEANNNKQREGGKQKLVVVILSTF